MLFVTARCRVHQDYRDDFLEQVNRIFPLVRAEPGCTRYELLADVFDRGLFMFCEEWESRRHLDDHIATPHMQDYFAKAAGWMTEQTKLTLYEISGIQSTVL
jgi:quinol monooxygenase YgiN